MNFARKRGTQLAAVITAVFQMKPTVRRKEPSEWERRGYSTFSSATGHSPLFLDLASKVNTTT